MDDRRVTLPELSLVETANIRGYSVDPGDSEVLLWISRHEAALPLARVFSSEADDEVAVLIVLPTGHLKHGWTADWTEADIAADIDPVVVKLHAPLGTRRLIDGKRSTGINELPQSILDHRAERDAR